MFLTKSQPSLALAPMEGYIDGPMRALLTETGGYDYCVSEFIRVSQEAPSLKSFFKSVPELKTGACTKAGVPVQIQILGGDPEKMALAAFNAFRAGAKAIDINFGCPAPTVNRHDGGATFLKFPERVKQIVSHVRKALPQAVPVSAKLRLGWENPHDIFKNTEQAMKGGASWITIHARTKLQGYKPPAHWRYIGEVKKNSSVPIVANGDIWNMDDFKRCQDETGCSHFMIGRGALADPLLSLKISKFLGKTPFQEKDEIFLWGENLKRFDFLCQAATPNPQYSTKRIKQWLLLGKQRGMHTYFEEIKTMNSASEIIAHIQHFAPSPTALL